MHVTTEGSTLSATAESGRRSRRNRPTSSPARCCASAALPPLPKVRTRLPRAYASTISRAASSTRGRSSSSGPSSAACSARASAFATRRSRAEPLVRHRRRTDDADRVAERRLDDPDLAPVWADRLCVHELAHRSEQLLAGAAHPAADHHELGLEEIGERSDTARKRLAGLVPDACRNNVPGQRGRGDVGGARDVHPLFPRALGDRRPRRVRLEAPAAPAAEATTAVPVDGDVAELAAVPRGAAEETAVDDDAAADAGRHREVDHVARAAARAVAVLGRGRGSRVVLQHCRQVERRRREVRDRDVRPARQVKRRNQHAAGRVERTAAPDPDPCDLLGGGAGRRNGTLTEGEEPLEPVARSAFRIGRRDDEAVDAAVGVDDAGRHLRAADVEAEDRPRPRWVRPGTADGGPCAHGRHSYPFVPWTAIPRMKYFWNTAKRITIGRTSSSVPAMITWKSPSPPPTLLNRSKRIFMPSGAVNVAWSR